MSDLSPAAILYDSDGNEVLVYQQQVLTVDSEAGDILRRILKELRVMNFHLSQLSGCAGVECAYNMEEIEE